jgi:tetratricopeptide (TPR) repeat protein
LEKLKQEIAAAQAAAADLQNQQGAEAAEARQALAQMLSNLSQRAGELGYNLPALEQALAALQAQQTDHLLRDLDFALDDLDKLLEMAQTLAELQRKAAQLGKDLAEQLQNAQIEAAQSSLRKMIDQLRSAQLDPEQRERILKELSKAINPGKMYGRAGDLLQEAANELKQQNDSQAAAKLAEAVQELERLLNQMCDAESLMAALEGLKKAGMCVGTGQTWGQCNYPGFKPGGKPGSGVGTWTEETGWLEYPQMTELWDNTGIERPDMDPRGHTDRGGAELAETVSPTKIRGQLTPGAPMPSITLKGLSVKGQSVVDYQEAITAAQSDAQNALNQDKVPRAYQGVVREYFDELK